MKSKIASVFSLILLFTLSHKNALLQAGEGMVTLLGQLPITDSNENERHDVTDVWGYLEPVTNREYAIVGYGLFNNPPYAGVSIIDVTDPGNPFEVANLNTVPGFDVKVWQHYLYTVNGSLGTGGIVDISDPAQPEVVGSFSSSHNIFIADNGFMYLEFPNGVRIYDLNPDPTNPELVWNGGSEGHDATVIGDRLYDFHGNSGTNIYDVSVPASPVLLGSITDPAIVYHHSGWPSEDGRYLFINDELAGHPTPDITAWDISDVDNPRKVGQFADPTATVHNLYIIGQYAFVSYYRAGFRVLDISDPTQIKIAAEFATSPGLPREGFGGAFGVYPFSPSGSIYVSDEQEGLFIFSFSDFPTDVESEPEMSPKTYALLQNHPNPFNPTTSISYTIPNSIEVKLVVFNALGQAVRTLVDEVQPAGNHRTVWNGRDDNGRIVPSGLYFYQIRAGEFVESKRMLLLK